MLGKDVVRRYLCAYLYTSYATQYTRLKADLSQDHYERLPGIILYYPFLLSDTPYALPQPLVVVVTFMVVH